MIIPSAFAATASTTTASVPPASAAPSAGEAFAMNAGLVIVMVALFYLLMIRPQQRRFKEHSEMLKNLDKGSRIVTQGGMIGAIEKVLSDNEVLVDFGSGVKMTILRSSIVGRYEDQVPSPASAKQKG